MLHCTKIGVVRSSGLMGGSKKKRYEKEKDFYMGNFWYYFDLIISLITVRNLTNLTFNSLDCGRKPGDLERTILEGWWNWAQNFLAVKQLDLVDHCFPNFCRPKSRSSLQSTPVLLFYRTLHGNWSDFNVNFWLFSQMKALLSTTPAVVLHRNCTYPRHFHVVACPYCPKWRSWALWDVWFGFCGSLVSWLLLVNLIKNKWHTHTTLLIQSF